MEEAQKRMRLEQQVHAQDEEIRRLKEMVMDMRNLFAQPSQPASGQSSVPASRPDERAPDDDAARDDERADAP